MRGFRSRVVLIMALVLVLTSCSPKIDMLQVNEFAWQPFRWVPYEFAGVVQEKAAIFVPIQFEGSDRRFWMQLDTAASSQMGAKTFESLGVQHRLVRHGSGYRVAEFNANIAGYEVSRMWLGVVDDQGTAIDPSVTDVRLGTLGMEFFHDKILVLDFPNSRLGIAATSGNLPKEITDHAKFYPAEVMRNRMIAVALSMGDRTIMAVYDTGSSSLPLVTEKDLWSEVTGRRGEEADNIKIEGPSWGRIIRLTGAAAQSEVRLHDFTLGRPTVYADLEGRAFAFNGTGYDGVIGNAPFYDRYIVILDPAGKRFGLVDTQIP